MHTEPQTPGSPGIPGDFWLGLVCALLGAGILWKAWGWPYYADGAPGPGFFPFWYGALMIAASVMLMVRALRHADLAEPFGTLRGLWRTGPVWVFYAGFVLLLPLIGFLLSFALFVFAMQVMVYRISPLKAAIASVVTSGVFFLLFDRLLSIQLPVLIKGVF